MKHRTGLTGAIYRSWVLVKCVWCGAYYWFRLRNWTGYGFHAFLTCILLLLLLIQCKISLYLRPVRPVRCFVTPVICVRLFLHRSTSHVVVNFFFFFLSFFHIWSNFNKLKTPDQWLWTCRQCWVHNKRLQVLSCSADYNSSLPFTTTGVYI